MRPDLLRTAATVLFTPSVTLLGAAALLAPLSAQDAAKAAEAADAGAPNQQAAEGLPKFLLPVPGGKVTMGMELDALWELCQSVSIAPKEHIRNAKNTRSELGVTTVDVEPCYISRTHVTNGQYKAFVDATGHRFPYHWWRFGESDDYNKRLREISEAFPNEKDAAPLDYWEQFWKSKSLPWSLKDKDGNDISDLPVTWVSKADAEAYAAWLGMRLPTEAERARAARGDTKATFVWGAIGNEDTFDKKSDSTLKLLGLYKNETQQLRPVGTSSPLLTGPYGHVDLAGLAWEWTLTRDDLLAGKDSFDDAWRDVRKHKILSEEEEFLPPTPQSQCYVIKGGSYAVVRDPLALHIDVRYAMEPANYAEILGFRVAKSPAPARDLMLSTLSMNFRRDLLQPDQEFSIAEQTGLERYQLDAKGTLLGYEGAGFAPVNFLTKNKKTDSWRELSANFADKAAPMLVGALVITTPLVTPEVPAGSYSVCFRPKGLPDELKKAIVEGNRGKDDGEWKSVVAKYGITEEEVAEKGAPKKINFIRLGGTDGVKISTDSDQFVFRNNDGQWVAALPVSSKKLKHEGSSVEVDAAGPGGAKVNFLFAPKILMGDKKDHPFALSIELAPAAKGGDTPWRVSGGSPD